MARNSKSTELMKWWMGEALIQIMKTKDFNKITADEITEKAGVGRASWFRNFHGKEEAVAFALQKRWENYASEKNMIIDDAHVRENAILYFEYIYSQKETLLSVYNAGIESAYYIAYTSVMVPEDSGNNASLIYHQKFFAFGLIGLVDEWIHRGFKETPSDMTDMFLNDIFHILYIDGA